MEGGVSMEGHLERLPRYGGPESGESLAEILCRVMDLALSCYNALVGDMVKEGNPAYDTYPTWVDFDARATYSVVEVTPDNAAGYHLPADAAGLVVRYDGAALAGVDSLVTAAELIEVASGCRVVLVSDDDRCGRSWWAEPAACS
jgi:hypothetical protein